MPSALLALLDDVQRGQVLLLGARPSWWPAPSGTSVELSEADAASAQPTERFNTVVVTSPATMAEPVRRRQALHAAMQHLLPNGHLVIVHHHHDALQPHELRSAVDEIATGAIGEASVTVFRRTSRRTVHDLLADARHGLRRVSPHALAAALRTAAPPLLLDTRTPSDRERHGTISGAHHIPRTVLEWRLDPANGYLHPAIIGFEQPIVVLCNHGYSSSLAARILMLIGYSDVADLEGGMTAWRAAGLAVVPPDHTFLEL